MHGSGVRRPTLREGSRAAPLPTRGAHAVDALLLLEPHRGTADLRPRHRGGAESGLRRRAGETRPTTPRARPSGSAALGRDANRIATYPPETTAYVLSPNAMGSRSRGRPCHRQARGAQFGRQRRPRSDDLPEGGEVLCAQWQAVARSARQCVAGFRGCAKRGGEAGLQKGRDWWRDVGPRAGLGTIPAWAANFKTLNPKRFRVFCCPGDTLP